MQSLHRSRIAYDASVRESNGSRCARSEIRIVRDEYDCGAGFAIERFEQLEHTRARACIEIAGWLVCEKNSRRICESPGDGNALLLSARKLHGEVMTAFCKADSLEQVVGSFTGSACALKLERDLDVLPCGECWNQLKTLEHESNFFASESSPIVLGHCRQVVSVEDHGSFRRCIETG